MSSTTPNRMIHFRVLQGAPFAPNGNPPVLVFTRSSYVAPSTNSSLVILRWSPFALRMYPCWESSSYIQVLAANDSLNSSVTTVGLTSILPITDVFDVSREPSFVKNTVFHRMGTE